LDEIVKVVSVSEMDDHLSAWISPGGTIYQVPECRHRKVAEAMGLSNDQLEEAGWIHLSYGETWIDPEVATDIQITIMAVIKMVRLPKVQAGGWGCSIKNFLSSCERLMG
jgi:hypothetical protein